MTQVGQDTLGTRSTMTVGGKEYAYYSFKKAAETIGDVSRLPFSMKVLLENLLRFEDGGFTISTDHIKAVAGPVLAHWLVLREGMEFTVDKEELPQQIVRDRCWRTRTDIAGSLKTQQIKLSKKYRRSWKE